MGDNDTSVQPNSDVVITDTELSKLFKRVVFGDCVTIIVKYLPPKDIVTLCRLYPKHWAKLYPYYKMSVIRSIDGWFRDYFGNKYNEFRQAMIDDKTVISGSFIIQAMLGEKWKSSDIDFFIGIKNATNMFEAIKKHKANPQLDPKRMNPNLHHTRLEIFLFNEPDVEDDEARYALHHNSANTDFPVRYLRTGDDRLFDRIKEYDVDLARNKIIAKFQVIELHGIKDVLGFIDSTFDFDICKNTFYYDKDGINLNILRACDIIDKIAGFKPCARLNSSLKRCRKYTERGFKFTDAIDYSTHYHRGARSEFIALQKELGV